MFIRILPAANLLFAVLLFVGLLSPMAGAGSAVLRVFDLVLLQQAHGAFDSAVLLTVAAFLFVSLGVMLLGPGAYSLDARLFGRREIIIPQRDHPIGE